MKKTKSKNKFLLTTSLSVVMGMTSFAAMAQTSTSMEQKDKLAKTVEVINAEVNTPFPDTNNKDAIYPKDVNNLFRTEFDNENFEFFMNNDKPINYKPYGKSTVNFSGYKIKSNDVSVNGFIVGHKEVENAGNPDVNTEGQFFKYWNTDAQSTIDSKNNIRITDAQFSPSFPKLCYFIKDKGMTPYSTEIKTDKKGKIIHPLIRLADVGGDLTGKQIKYEKETILNLPVVPVTTNDIIDFTNTEHAKYKDFNGLRFKQLTSFNPSLPCDTTKGCYLKWNPSLGCYDVNPYGYNLDYKVNDADPLKTFDYVSNDLLVNTPLVNCSSGTSGACPSNQVQSFRRNNSNEPYRMSQWVKLDIEGNIEPIEVPQQTCYNCVNIGDAIDATCEHIVDEVFKAKNGNCAETVKALATHPRAVKSWLPYDLNSPSNCKSCLCKIEGLLQAKGCK